MRGTTLPINKAMIRPVMMAGVEKQLALLNALLCFPLIAATHFQLPWCFLGLMFYIFFFKNHYGLDIVVIFQIAIMLG